MIIELEVRQVDRLSFEQGEEVRITLQFSLPLADAPLVRIGSGPAPLRVRMKGEKRDWEGNFDAAGLAVYRNWLGGIPIRVEGTGAVRHRRLDGDPATGAGQLDSLQWVGWEESRDDLGEGRGGEDTWHVFNVDVEGGNSHVFVLALRGEAPERLKYALKERLFRMAVNDEVSIVGPGVSVPRVLVPFTFDRKALEKAIDSYGGGRDADPVVLEQAAKRLLDSRARYSSRGMTLIMDGRLKEGE